MKVMATRRRSQVSKSAASKRFGQYKREDAKKHRNAEIKPNETTAKLRRLWQRFIEVEDPKSGFQEAFDDNAYKDAVEILGQEKISAEDIMVFLLSLTEKDVNDDSLTMDRYDQRGYLGIFISAMVNESRDSDFVLRTEQLDFLIDCLGYRNRKIITITGDVGQYLGCGMEDGSITVMGRAENQFGDQMTGGEIHLEGDGEYSPTPILSTLTTRHAGYPNGGRVYYKDECLFPVPISRNRLKDKIEHVVAAEEALLYNDRLEQIALVEAGEIEKALGEKTDAFAVVIASDITQELVDIGQKNRLGILVGFEIKGVERIPEGMELVPTVPEILVYEKQK
jgi:hypothetical protein